jgi:ubiquinone/menaquinone biosynthesis C-methylase UbiE
VPASRVAGVCDRAGVDDDLWDAYDRMGLSFAQHAADSAYNAHYDRPAVLAALGPVAGRHVLDAACGPGIYVRELLDRGAEVTAFDASPVMVSLARQRVPGRVRIDRAVLGEPLPYPDRAFDFVVCALAIHYAGSRAAAFAEFWRVLRPGGAAVVSTQHPVMDWLRKGGSYFQVTLETDVCPVRSRHRCRIPYRKTYRAAPRGNNARALSRGLRETAQGTWVPDSAPAQAGEPHKRRMNAFRALLTAAAGNGGAVAGRPRGTRHLVSGMIQNTSP